MSFTDWLQHSWNAFTNRDPTKWSWSTPTSSSRPDRLRINRNNDKTLATTVINRIAVDCALCDVKHVQLDESGRYIEDINSFLNDRLGYSANLDQTGRQLILDSVMSLLDEGTIAICPIEWDKNPTRNVIVNDERDLFPIYSMRVGKIVQWRPKSVVVHLYNEDTGNFQDAEFPKDIVAIPENPFYSIMNTPNSLAKRLNHKIALLDAIDDRNGAGKLDLIIQVPYQIKNELQRKHATESIKDIELQLSSSKYGIAYIDATEHVTQLNRSVDNQLLKQIEDLKKEYLDALGITPEILNGTANDEVMTNYMSRIVEPILVAITEEMSRKFLNASARAGKQAVKFFREPFKLIPVADLAELIDKLTRNAVVTANECRQFMGMKPSNDPMADQLKNANISQPNQQAGPIEGATYDANGNLIEGAE